MKDIGIKNVNSIFRLIVIVLFTIAAFSTFIFWMIIVSDLHADSMYRYGKEVQAEITEVVEHTDDDTTHSYWKTYYEYVDDDGTKYSGGAYSFDSKSKAEEYIGKALRVVINTKTGESEIGTLEHFKKESEGYQTHFTCACAFSSFLAVISVPFFYRVVFRVHRNNKIVNKLKSRYVDRGTICGEVVKIFGLIWFYVNVKFTDEFGITHEKWAGDLFTRKEANFLNEKKYISIVPYKGAYGILEQMPTVKRLKKRKKDE